MKVWAWEVRKQSITVWACPTTTSSVPGTRSAPHLIIQGRFHQAKVARCFSELRKPNLQDIQASEEKKTTFRNLVEYVPSECPACIPRSFLGILFFPSPKPKCCWILGISVTKKTLRLGGLVDKSKLKALILLIPYCSKNYTWSLQDCVKMSKNLAQKSN